MKVIVGAYQYDLIRARPNVLEGKWGDIHNGLLRMRVDADSHMQVQKVCLLHEAIHSMSWQRNLGLHDDVVVALAPAIVSFLETNGVDLSPIEAMIDLAPLEE